MATHVHTDLFTRAHKQTSYLVIKTLWHTTAGPALSTGPHVFNEVYLFSTKLLCFSWNILASPVEGNSRFESCCS